MSKKVILKSKSYTGFHYTYEVIMKDEKGFSVKHLGFYRTRKEANTAD